MKHPVGKAAGSAAVAALVLFGISAPTVPSALPGALKVGSASLAPASCAVRKTLWIQHYAASLYVPPQASAVDALQDAARPKALQVLILSKTFLPSELPKKYRRTLEGQLDGDTMARVRAAYRELEPGDLVTLAYAPGPGMSLELNGDVVASTASHAVIEALLREWADGEPVPQRLSSTIQRNPC
ncbi:MAG: chalcone isomerase family protein [Betaproteobacteria bacterium]